MINTPNLTVYKSFQRVNSVHDHEAIKDIGVGEFEMQTVDTKFATTVDALRKC